MTKKRVIVFVAAGAILAGVIIVIIAVLVGHEHSHDKKGSKLKDLRLEELSALPYLAHVKETRKEDEVGVVVHDIARAYRGFTVYGCRDRAKEFYLFDMEGNLLHAWNPTVEHGRSMLWMRPDRDGNFIALGRGYLIEMDWKSKVVWEGHRSHYHHGFAQDERGRIYALTQRQRDIRYSGRVLPILDHQIMVLDPDGRLFKEISVFNLAERWISRELAEQIIRIVQGQPVDRLYIEEKLGVNLPFDVFHLNSVTIIDRDIGIAKKGDLLICLRNVDLVLIVDPEREKVVWAWTEGQHQLDRPHRPVLLKNNNILIFDNGWRRGYSRILELNPITKKIVWQYTATPKESFYTRRGGFVQKLPNGNVLITETEKGRIFEITTEGKIVWDFYNVKFGEGGKRRTIYRAYRLHEKDLKHLQFDASVMANLKTRGYFR